MKLVLRLNRAARIGAVLILAGVALGLYGRMKEVAWASRASVAVIVVGAILYYTSRFRSFRQKRKQ